jgi:drug/metabolite transporter (DMT)-like permease
MTHGRAAALMVLCSLMWGSAGPIVRQLEHADGLEITFWRSVFAALTVGLWLGLRKGWRSVSGIVQGGRTVWISGLMWAVMFTCFTLALSLTQVANVLVMQSLAPVFTALLAAVILKHPISGRTWFAIAVAAVSVVSMYVFDIAELDRRHSLGMLLSLAIPAAAAINWVTLKREGAGLDLSGAVLVGGVLSAALALFWVGPFQASIKDLFLLAVLGVFQLALPCILAMKILRYLKAPEAALLSMLEIVFGIGLTWLIGGENPSTAALVGGVVLLMTLAWHEAEPRRAPSSRPSGQG